jgi:translation initiation factor 2B subunit (eIF-2B alpha/beta/delta family)
MVEAPGYLLNKSGAIFVTGCAKAKRKTVICSSDSN